MEGVCYGEESDVMSHECALSEFGEIAEVRAVISSLPDIHHDQVCRENTFEKFVGKTSPCACYCSIHIATLLWLKQHVDVTEIVCLMLNFCSYNGPLPGTTTFIGPSLG